MAEILRGRRKGQQVEVIEVRNNYAQFMDGSHKHITVVLFTGDEIRRIKEAKNTGTLFIEFQDSYDPVLDGHLFRRKRRHYAYN